MRTVALWVAVVLAVAAQVSPVYARCCTFGGGMGRIECGPNQGPCQEQKLQSVPAACEAKCPNKGDDEKAFKEQEACMNKECPGGKLNE
jgi:hypothetical protein